VIRDALTPTEWRTLAVLLFGILLGAILVRR
jgi:hypothetical protein